MGKSTSEVLGNPLGNRILHYFLPAQRAKIRFR